MGLAGGLHCVGMCAPLVLVATARRSISWSNLPYNIGRVFTYGLLGAVVGTIGGVIQPLQNAFAYILGGLFLLIGFGAISGLKVPLLSSVIHQFTTWLKITFGDFLKSRKNIFFMGMLNGLLPCGLTYLALSYCLTLDTFAEGFLFMLTFGAGTIPMMTGFLWIFSKVINKITLTYKKVSLIVMVVVGGLIIGRAMIAHDQRDVDKPQTNVFINDVLCR